MRIEGVASQLLREDVALYFSARPRGAQLGAWASHQSSQVADRERARGRVRRGGDALPREHRGPGARRSGAATSSGPTMVEFWQGRRGRLHDRLVYRRTDDADVWTIERLAP